jgi:hypothetical protein
VPEPFADNRFRFTTAIAPSEFGINVSSVDQIKSGGDESIEQLERRSLIRRPTEHASTERQRRHLQS